MQSSTMQGRTRQDMVTNGKVKHLNARQTKAKAKDLLKEALGNGTETCRIQRVMVLALALC